MLETRIKVLLIEDNPGDARLLQEALRDARETHLELEWTKRLADALERLPAGGLDVVLMDLTLPDSRGLDTFRRVQEIAPQLPIVVLSGTGIEDITVRAVQLGAQDFLVKGESDGRLIARSLRYAIQRKRAEEEIRKLNAELEARVEARTAELAETNKELEEFNYSVSHDLKAPLLTIEGFSQAVAEECGGDISPSCRDYLGRTIRATTYMRGLIEAMLDLSRLGRHAVRREPVDLAAIAREVTATLLRDEPGRQVELRLPDHLEATADPELMRVVLQNLFSNALKFTAPKDRAVIEFGASRSEGRTAFYVRDNGVGFDMTYVEKLFTPFQRLHGPAEFEGFGIGLATAARIIRRHGGNIWAHGTLDQGATFYFTL